MPRLQNAQAISIAMTTVLPLPVAILQAWRGIGFPPLRSGASINRGGCATFASQASGRGLMPLPSISNSSSRSCGFQRGVRPRASTSRR